MAGLILFAKLVLLLLHVCPAFQLPSSKPSSRGVHASAAQDDSLSLLQVQRARLSTAHDKVATQHLRSNAVMCKSLQNFGTYFTMKVNVGTPPQSFDLIPDTGSNSVVIPDCKCVRSGRCGPFEQKCFASGRSSSFTPTDLSKMFRKVKTEDGDEVYAPLEANMHFTVQEAADGKLYAELTYGSGPIRCSLGTDRVGFDNTSANLEDGLFLMQSRERLKIAGLFSGLMGFGISTDPATHSFIEDEKLYMKKAGIERYSMCYNAGGEDGYLKYNLPPLTKPLGNVGVFHWGLDLQGISAGDASSPILVCGPNEKKPGMQTACGFIPDSGTTNIIGPKDQIFKLFTGVCDKWPRCTAAAKQYPSVSKEEIFYKLLMDCGKWLGKGERALDNEVPPITVHLAGLSGEKQEVEISSWAWIAETTVPKFKEIHRDIFGHDFVYPVPVGTTKTCSPSISSHEYDTKLNGPVWVFGGPLFYDKTISYDLNSKPPSVSIDDTPCTPCDTQLLSTSGQRRGQGIRKLEGPTRKSSIDVTKPL